MARLGRTLPLALLVALGALAIYTFGWRGGGAGLEERERAKAATWARVLAVSGEDGVVRSLTREEPYLWTTVVEKPDGVVCFVMYVDPTREGDQPGFDFGTVAQIPCPESADAL